MYKNIKIIKTDKITTATQEYLKNRSFEVNTDVKCEDDEDSHISLEERVSLKELISPTCPNMFTFSTTSSHYNFIEQQYIRLKSWMTEASEPCRSELSQVLFPLFVHLFLELLTGVGKQAAKFFFSRHHQVFRVNRDYEQTLKQVWSAAGEAAASSPVIQSLKTGKYIVRLSELTLNYFLRYLQTTNNPTLLQIFNNFLEVELSEASWGGSSSSQSAAQSLLETYYASSDSNSKVRKSYQSGADHSPEEMLQLEEVISAVRSAKASSVTILPSVRVYSLLNAYNGLTLAAVSADSRLLACGFEDSVVKIWRLTPPLQSDLDHDPPHRAKASSPPAASSSSSSSVDFILFCDAFRRDDDEDGGDLNEGKEEREEEKRKEEEEELGEEEGDEEDEEDDDEGEDRGTSVKTTTIGGRHTSGGEWCILRGHRGPVFDAAFVGPRGGGGATAPTTHLYTVGDDATMRLWDLTTKRAVALYQGHHYPIWCLDVSNHAMYVATGSYDETARLWTAECAYPVRALMGHTGSVDCVAFHPNCSYVASGSHDKTIRLWQVNDASVARVLLHHNSPVRALRFSPDGKFLASGSETGEIFVWDLVAGKVIRQVSGGGGNSNSSSDGGAPQNTSEDGSDPVVSIDWSKDSKILFSATSDGYVKGTYFSSLEGTETGEVETIYCGQNNYSNSSNSSGSSSGNPSLIHMSLSNHNFISTVVAINGER